MRTLLFPLLMTALTAAASGPEKMTVVVRTTDRVVVDFACVGPAGNYAYTDLFKREVVEPGKFAWHVVGGTAPYTVLKNDIRAGQGGCITVQDANGQVATSCGVIQEVHEIRRVNCNLYDREQQENSIYAVPPSKADTCKKDHKPCPPTTAPPVKPHADPTLNPHRTKTASSGDPVMRLPIVRGPITTPVPPPVPNGPPKPPVKPGPVGRVPGPSPVRNPWPKTGDHRDVQRTTGPAMSYSSGRPNASRPASPAPAGPRPVGTGNGTYRVSPTVR